MTSSAIEVQMEASGKLLIPQALLQRMGLSSGGGCFWFVLKMGA